MLKKSSSHFILFFFLYLFLSGSCAKDTVDTPSNQILPNWKNGQVLSDDEGWIECYVGDFPLVLSVPHGGSINPQHLPDQECDDATTVKDTYTVELAEAIQDVFQTKYNKKPFVIISHLARTKLDQNRSLEEALCESQPEMEAAWHWYHHHVDSAVRLAADKYGEALFVDLHAHGHDIQRLELGYGLTISEIGKVYSGIELNELMSKSSMTNYKDLNPEANFRELLIGENAFGTLMAERGLPSVPSKQDPYPMSSEKYFNGGYNTRFFTSSDYTNVYGWQIETNSSSRNTQERREDFAEAFAESILKILNI
ncbi:MAG TPA: hypothetical protein VK102_10260 [Sphingobacterium sp.]|nr:hypothetical protein [Sphingobacterium sp.]